MTWRGVLAAAVLAAAGCGGCAADVADGVSLLALSKDAPRRARSVPVIYVELAATTAVRRRGLSGRAVLPLDGGMLFYYRAAEPRTFWMKDCMMGLDIAFLDDDARIVSLFTLSPGAGLAFEDVPRAVSREPARFVLETAAGWLQAQGIGEGDQVDVSQVIEGVEPD